MSHGAIWIAQPGPDHLVKKWTLPRGVLDVTKTHSLVKNTFS